MNMHWVDWTIVGALVALLVGVLIFCQRFVRSTADFLAANRCAGRYILAISGGIAGLGAISVIAVFEQYYAAGFTPIWWGMMSGPLGLLLAIAGWVYYRFRETRAMTMAQFFEVRYSRNFRVFAGMLAWLSGIVNYGIFPAVTVRFFIYFCGLPDAFSVGGVELSTYPCLLGLTLGMGALFACCGGQVAIMVTDFLQGMFCNTAFLIILVFLFLKFSWGDIFDPLLANEAANPQASMLNPIKTTQLSDFNIWYYLIGVFGAIYSAGAWLGSQGYQVAAKSPHEAKMASFLGTWRGMAQTMLLLFIPICAYAVLHNPAFSGLAAEVNASLATVDNPQIRTQITVPVTLVKLLPVGLVGLFAAVMAAAMLSTDNTYMHSWGSIFIQDVIMPFRKKPFGPKQHLWMLRLSIIFVGIFAFTFSYLFKQTEYILMFFAITGAIFLGGAGSVIIGGLYSRKGTTAGAWTAMLVGSTLAVGSIILQQTWGNHVAPQLIEMFPDWNWIAENSKKFPINGQIMYFFAMVAALGSYIIASLIERSVTGKPDFDLEKMLHRDPRKPQPPLTLGTLKQRTVDAIGLSKDFTRRDKIIMVLTMCWSFGWFFVFIIGTIIETTVGFPVSGWVGFWKFYLILVFLLGVVTTVWFLIGGSIDIAGLFKALGSAVRNDNDDGRVVDGKNAGEE